MYFPVRIIMGWGHRDNHIVVFTQVLTSWTGLLIIFCSAIIKLLTKDMAEDKGLPQSLKAFSEKLFNAKLLQDFQGSHLSFGG